MPRLTRALRLLLAVALLCAQQAALAHAVWHAGKKEAQPAQQQLCAQHGALDSVAGALDAALPPRIEVVPHSFSCTFVERPAAPLRGMAPVSRGPPAVA